MKLCKTCKHWRIPTIEENRIMPARIPSTIPSCFSPKIVFGEKGLTKSDMEKYAIWRKTPDMPCPKTDLIILDAESDEPISSDMAGILDGSGYWGSFIPGPDFGCIHHEEK